MQRSHRLRRFTIQSAKPRQKRHHLGLAQRLGVQELQRGHVLPDALWSQTYALGQMTHSRSRVIGAEFHL